MAPLLSDDHEQLTLNLLFEVEDTGPGIAPIALEHLFDPFIQASTSQKSQSGTGLGLAISQKLAQLLGGEINVRSSLGQGTTFRVNLSVCLARTADVQPQQRLRRAIGLVPNQPTYRILVVEDDRASRKLLAKLLESLGFEVQEAENGQIAVDLWDIWSPHLIWMDIRMPVMDGYEATRKIKTRGAMLGAGGRGQKAGGRGQRVKSQNRKQGTLDIHDNYEDAPEDGSVWLSDDKNSGQVVRGGSWSNIPRNCRSASRVRDDRDFANDVIGFRVVCSVPRSS